MIFLGFYIFFLHVLGAITFYNLIDNADDLNGIKTTINEMSAHLRIILMVVFWPLIMGCWCVMAIAPRKT